MIRLYHNVNSFAIVAFAYGCEAIVRHESDMALIIGCFVAWFLLKTIAVGGKGITHMLVMSRKVGEKIEIGDNIVIMVTDIRGDKCRIGIKAPPEIRVHRSEVSEKIRKANEVAL